MDFLPASHNTDNNNTNEIPRYRFIRLSNPTQMQTRDMENQDTFQLKPLTDGKGKYDSSASRPQDELRQLRREGKGSGNFTEGKSQLLASSKPVKLTRMKISKFGKMYSFLWRRQWQPTPVLLPGKSHGRRSLVGCNPWGCEESDTTESLHFHFSLSCMGEGNSNPLQCSCLENPRDGGAWWAATSGVTQSRT